MASVARVIVTNALLKVLFMGSDLNDCVTRMRSCRLVVKDVANLISTRFDVKCSMRIEFIAKRDRG